MDIGPKLKQLRLSKKLTIKDLAARTGLSGGFISNVERDVNSPTISSLQKICQALNTNIGELFTAAKSQSHLVVRKAERQTLRHSPEDQAICAIVPMYHKMLQPSCIDIKPQGKYGVPLLKHNGEEICFVLKGQVQFWVGEECHELNEGDCIYVESQAEHYLYNPGEQVAQTFWVTWNGEGDF